MSIKNLYNYLLISNSEIYTYVNSLLNKQVNNLPITKYIPSFNRFFNVGEIFKKFNISIIKDDNILLFSNSLNFIEYITYNNYKINNITTIVSFFYKENENFLSQYINYINSTKHIYKLPKLYIKNIKKKYNIVIYNFYDLRKIYYYENNTNIPNIFIGALVGLKYTEIGGTFILHFGSVAYKQLADIYLILSHPCYNHAQNRAVELP